MLKFYIHLYQLNNFLKLKEPVQLILTPINENYVEVYYDLKKLEINRYNSHITIEIKTRRKKWRKLWQKIRHPRKKI